ncbi:MAG: hypothetical protein JWO94_2137 [Verrucomicrobiaceae bacterium]|nr:hypothetical protein [Verrucomicrobiaceae bacterium]
MKTAPFFLVAVAALLTSCVNPIERRVSFYPGMYSELSEADKQAVNSGPVREGMSKDGVYLAWGAPSHAQVGKREGKTYERWIYLDYQPVFTGGYGVGVGGGYWGRPGGYYGGFYDPYFFGGPAIGYMPTDSRRVEFVNNRVTSFLAPLPR